MNYQLSSVLRQAISGGERMIDIYQALECLARHSFMAPHTKARYPELGKLTNDDILIEGGLSASRSVRIINKDHPLCGVTYIHHPLQRVKSDLSAYDGISGYFIDPEEKILKYVRKELF